VSAFIDVNVTGTLNLLEAAVAASHDRFVFTSTTSLMISDSIHRGEVHAAIWLDENFGPLAPRNIYGITKLAAEGLCRVHFLEHGLNCVILRAGRFFPEEDDTRRELPGPNLKANEFLNRRLTVEDSTDAHVMALDRAPALGFEIFILSAPTPFDRSEAEELQRSVADVIARHFPDSPMLYARRGWQLPRRIGRVYDASRIERLTGFRCATDFGRVLDALRAAGCRSKTMRTNSRSFSRPSTMPSSAPNRCRTSGDSSTQSGAYNAMAASRCLAPSAASHS
jgi:UDP-glucose 4-epimerase